jgi:hypothetical protein
VLVESDHGYKDPPAAIPCRVEWVEYLAAQQYRMRVEEMRRLTWTNLLGIFCETKTIHLIPPAMADIFAIIAQSG